MLGHPACAEVLVLVWCVLRVALLQGLNEFVMRRRCVSASHTWNAWLEASRERRMAQIAAASFSPWFDMGLSRIGIC